MDHAPRLLSTYEIRKCELLFLARALRVQLLGEAPAATFEWLRREVNARP